MSPSAVPEIESWLANVNDEASVAGHVEATAHVTGPVSEPRFRDQRRSIAWSNVQVSTIRATGGYGAGQLSLNALTLGVAGGTVEGHGRLP
jgi:hypothetical protein